MTLAQAQTDLELARRQYAQANARADVGTMLKSGLKVRELVQACERLGAFNDNGQSAFAIGRTTLR